MRFQRLGMAVTGILVVGFVLLFAMRWEHYAPNEPEFLVDQSDRQRDHQWNHDGEVQVSTGAGIVPPAVSLPFEGVLEGQLDIMNSNGRENYEFEIHYSDADRLVSMVRTSPTGEKLYRRFAGGVLTTVVSATIMGDSYERVENDVSFDSARYGILGPAMASALAGDVQGSTVLGLESGNGVDLKLIESDEFDPVYNEYDFLVHSTSLLPAQLTLTSLESSDGDVSETWLYTAVLEQDLTAADLPVPPSIVYADGVKSGSMVLATNEVSGFLEYPVYGAGQSVGNYTLGEWVHVYEEGGDVETSNIDNGEVFSSTNYVEAAYFRSGSDWTDQITVTSFDIDNSPYSLVDQDPEYISSTVQGLPAYTIDFAQVAELDMAGMGIGRFEIVVFVPEGTTVISAPDQALAELAADQLALMNP